MNIEDEIKEAFESLQLEMKGQTKFLASYMANRQEQVMLSIEAGEDWQAVLKQSLVNIRAVAAKEATKAADEADAAWWGLFWRSWQAGMSALIDSL